MNFIREKLRDDNHIGGFLLNFVLSKPFIDKGIGVNNVAQLKFNINSLNKSFSDDMLEALVLDQIIPSHGQKTKIGIIE